MARVSKSGDYSYTRTAKVRGLKVDERYAVIQKDRDNTRVVERRGDGTAPGPGVLVPTVDVYDVKPTHVVLMGQRGTITLPGELRRDLGIEEGTPLEIIKEDDGRLSVQALSRTPASTPAADLNQLLDGITAENVHGEIPTGESVGREAW